MYIKSTKKAGRFQETIDFPEDNMLKKKKIISYDDAHAAIMVNAQNQKMAGKIHQLSGTIKPHK